ncbi:TOPRIM domain, partial [Dillenia turbinata]
MELEFKDERIRKWNSCDPIALYHAPVDKFIPQGSLSVSTSLSDKLDIKRTLEEEARKRQWLILWLDCDQEGEIIAFEVVEVSNYFVEGQIVIDVSTDERNLVMSYGPYQLPTLALLWNDIGRFGHMNLRNFLTINCSHNYEQGTATFCWMKILVAFVDLISPFLPKRGHMFDYSYAVTLYKMCFQGPVATISHLNRDIHVTKVQQPQLEKRPPHPLNTIELEKRASLYFRMSSEQTMK